jgi:Methyltransferase domain
MKANALAVSILDVVLTPLVYLSAFLLKLVRKIGVDRIPHSRQALMRVGVFPIVNHYYEPLFDTRSLSGLDKPRTLPGIDWNKEEQLFTLLSFQFGEELSVALTTSASTPAYNPENTAFGGGDASYLYSMIRLKKPQRIIEIGSGHSTLIAMRAIAKNREEDPAYQCQHTCIEPYEMPWLERTGAIIVREKVEDVDRTIFDQLGCNDILFIDSSHIIRPQGDVVFEYLEVLPSLRAGVIVHIHDIFSPRDYPARWIKDQVKLWNEQYMLESFLSCNRDWKILGAVNALHHTHYELLKERCPWVKPEQEPGSFYIQKVLNSVEHQRDPLRDLHASLAANSEGLPGMGTLISSEVEHLESTPA